MCLSVQKWRSVLLTSVWAGGGDKETEEGKGRHARMLASILSNCTSQRDGHLILLVSSQVTS